MEFLKTFPSYFLSVKLVKVVKAILAMRAKGLRISSYEQQAARR